MPKNVFVVGLDDFNRLQLQQIRNADRYRFHSLVDYEEIRRPLRFPVGDVLRKAEGILDRFSGSVDAIVGYWDFPVSTMLPLLRQPRGLPGPTLESVLKCEHKYWSRIEQREVAAGHVPRFCAVDPFGADPRAQIDLDYPFWLKPVKSASSHLGFKIRHAADLGHAIDAIRENIAQFAEPFNYILQQAECPPEIAEIDGYHCIAEEIISAGKQCTQEGYAYHGEVTVYGTVDSIREGKHRSPFSRYQYPSSLPRRVRERMDEITRRVLTHIGYDDAPFNIEYYWNTRSDALWLLEINSRISKSHAPLFHMVDGAYHHEIMVDLALGERPSFPHRQGEFRYAAKFMCRLYRDARVTHVPDRKELEEVQRAFPEALIEIHVQPGIRLSELRNQDSYSYEVAVIFLGGNSRQELRQKYRQCIEMLPLRFSQ
ncbi:MAG: ATP-grasp domain-containing protein [Gammaproteobacteria bacterium]|nr:ATP-grasp domain-containing protein [Gammaproteobacteria bacterium]NIR90372.1 ATP-grasp domain-containing protein [Gammaproteobacteria bacterium]